ncbi:MAG TPA: NB-ARC domain-containing protein, partial [Ktedonobacteraceae bacterium]|nr:NB-ARC domain-containing protein [Ktedonobacteraceae bacterium]
PNPSNLKVLLAFALKQRAFPAGREAEEVRAFWHAAHQKVLIDEAWLQEVLDQIPSHPTLVANAPVEIEPPLQPRVDWGDALDVASFYGRERELAQLSHWIVQERCRVVSVLGMGGIGKSALTISMMHQVAPHFEFVIWRSLRDVPTCEALLDGCLQVLAPQALHAVSLSLERHLSLLLECLRRSRVLLVLDNLETLLEEGQSTGHMRPGSEDYVQLLRRMAETEHQSCLLLTSREKPIDLVPFEGKRTPVRVLRLARLDSDACDQLLAEKDVVGTMAERTRLSEMYAGNPLALKIVAQTIVELFAGEIALFLEQGGVVFGGVRELLSEQYARLSELEQTVLCWLAIAREPMTVGELRAVLVATRTSGELLEALDGLRRRSLIERGQRAGSFTLQSVVLEYVTTRLVMEAGRELEQGRLTSLLQYGLSQASARDYVRQTQERLLLTPLLTHLQHSMPEQPSSVEAQLRSLLAQLRTWSGNTQGYGPANVTTLLRLLRGNLRGLDLSRLLLRDLSLQGVEMQDVLLAGATLQGCIFTEAFEDISAIAISRSGHYWAAGSGQGEVWIWDEGGQVLHQMWRAHMDRIRALAFSPDGHSLVTGSWDNTVKLWDVSSGSLLWLDWQGSNLASVAFAPDGRVLATSGGTDATVHLWDLHNGTRIQTLAHPYPVSALAWSPDGRFLACGNSDGSIRVWEQPCTQQATEVQTLSGHTSWVMGLAFAPDGSLLASGSWDGTVKLWEMPAGRLHLALAGHTDRVNRVAWSDDGQTLATCGRDKTIRLWDVAQGQARGVLQGHTRDIFGLTFTSDNRSLLSGSDDGTLRLWEVASGRCTRVMHGHVSSLFDVAWSPDGTQLVSGGTDALVTLWDVARGKPLKVLHGHRWSVSGVEWNAEGKVLASSGWDGAIRLWDLAAGTNIKIPEYLDDPDTIFFSIAWSPDGGYLAAGTHASGVLVWDVRAHSGRWVGRELPIGIRHVTWSLDGTRLIGTGDGSTVYVWDALDGSLLQQLAGHQGISTCLAWSADGTQLASGGRSRGNGSLLVWDVQHGECRLDLLTQVEVISAVAWSPQGDMLISGDSEGKLCWWDMSSGECVRVHAAHQGKVQSLKRSPDGRWLASCGDDGAIMLWDLRSGEQLQTMRRDRPYERLNITGIKGLSEAQKETLRALGAIEDIPVPGNEATS